MSGPGVIGAVAGGTSIINAILVQVQKVDYDVKDSTNVGFLFATRGEDRVSLRSEITDHYSEYNKALQDQIALKPIEVTLTGYVAELSDLLPGILSRINDVVSQLTTLAPYAPQLTLQALQAYNQAKLIYEAAASAYTTIEQTFGFENDLGIGFGGGKQTQQQKAYHYFKSRWEQRQLFKVITPWEVFEDMAILSCEPIQGEESRFVSDFQITFKQLRFASVLTSELSIAQGRRAVQNATETDKGSQGGTSVGPYTPNASPFSSGVVR